MLRLSNGVGGGNAGGERIAEVVFLVFVEGESSMKE